MAGKSQATANQEAKGRVSKRGGKLVISDPAQAAKRRLAEMDGWADWTVEQAAEEIEATVKGLADVKTLLAQMAAMLVCLRDQISS